MKRLDGESMWTWLKTGHKIWFLLAAIAGFGLLLYVIFYVDSCNFQRGVDKDKKVIANHMDNAANIKKEITNLERDYAVEIERAKEASNQLLIAQGASNAQMANTNAALEQMNAAINANRGNVNAEDINKLLDQLK